MTIPTAIYPPVSATSQKIKEIVNKKRSYLKPISFGHNNKPRQNPIKNVKRGKASVIVFTFF